MERYGVLVISHGSRDGKWVRLVDEAVAQVLRPSDIPIVSSFLEIVEGRLIQDGIRTLERQGVTDIIAVPLFVSSGSTHVDEIGYALGAKPEPELPTDLTPFERSARIHFTSPIDDDPIIAAVLYDKIKDLTNNPSREIVLLIGHGSKEQGFHDKWRRGLELLASRVKELGGFDEADAAMLLPDQVHRQMKLWAEKKPGHAVIVVPLFLSEGYFTRTVIPNRLQGYTYRYNGKALLPNASIPKWIEGQIAPFIRLRIDID